PAGNSPKLRRSGICTLRSYGAGILSRNDFYKHPAPTALRSLPAVSALAAFRSNKANEKRRELKALHTLRDPKRLNHFNFNMNRNYDLLTKVYSAFNARDIDTGLAALSADVDWPNGWEGGRIYGREGVRDYWTRQWAAIDPSVEPVGFDTDETGRTV